MARYLIVKINDDDMGPNCLFVRVRRALHEFKGVSDMGVHGASPLTASERRLVVEAFENGMKRAKAAQKAAEEESEGLPEGYTWKTGVLESYRHLVKYCHAEALCGTIPSAGARIRNTYKEKCSECVALAEGLA